MGVLLACGSDSTGPGDPPDCAGPVAFAVELPRESPPRFAWTPDCVLADLIVEPDGAHGDVYWHIHMASPPVRYGGLPPGASEAASSRPLEPGRSYLVGGVWHDGATARDAGHAIFTP